MCADSFCSPFLYKSYGVHLLLCTFPSISLCRIGFVRALCPVADSLYDYFLLLAIVCSWCSLTLFDPVLRRHFSRQQHKRILSWIDSMPCDRSRCHTHNLLKSQAKTDILIFLMCAESTSSQELRVILAMWEYENERKKWWCLKERPQTQKEKNTKCAKRETNSKIVYPIKIDVWMKPQKKYPIQHNFFWIIYK